MADIVITKKEDLREVLREEFGVLMESFLAKIKKIESDPFVKAPFEARAGYWARMKGVNERTFKRWAQHNDIPYRQDGRSKYYRKSDIGGFFDIQKAQ